MSERHALDAHPVRIALDAHRNDDMIDTVRNGLCPWCDAGPFVVPATHIKLKHGIGRKELRQILGITNSHESLCDPSYSARMTDRNREMKLAASIANTIGPEGRAKAARTRQDRYRRIAEERDRAIIARYQSGGTIDDVASEMSLSTQTVLNAMHRHGIHGRPSHLQATQAFIAAAASRRRARHEFIRQGGTVEELATMTGVDPRTLRYQLRQAGVEVARGESPRHDRTCAECNLPFTTAPGGNGAKYCSAECKREARNRRRASA